MFQPISQRCLEPRNRPLHVVSISRVRNFLENRLEHEAFREISKRWGSGGSPGVACWKNVTDWLPVAAQLAMTIYVWALLPQCWIELATGRSGVVPDSRNVLISAMRYDVVRVR